MRAAWRGGRAALFAYSRQISPTCFTYEYFTRRRSYICRLCARFFTWNQPPMSYAQRGAAMHNRIRSRFGTDADGAQLYVWHNSAAVTAYQPSGTRTRDILAASLARNETITVHATKSEFTTAPKPGDTIKLGTVLTTARTLRIDTVNTTHVRAFYEIAMIDPNVATTAAIA